MFISQAFTPNGTDQEFFITSSFDIPNITQAVVGVTVTTANGLGSMYVAKLTPRTIAVFFDAPPPLTASFTVNIIVPD